MSRSALGNLFLGTLYARVTAHIHATPGAVLELFCTPVFMDVDKDRMEWDWMGWDGMAVQ